MQVRRVPIEVESIDLRPEDEVVDGMWASCFKPSRGLPKCQMAAWGLRQKDGLNYDSSDVATPVICDIAILLCLILCIIAGWAAWIVDVEGVFLQGSFQNGERIFMKVPDGFQKYHPSCVLLRLLCTIYGLKQAVMQF